MQGRGRRPLLSPIWSYLGGLSLRGCGFVLALVLVLVVVVVLVVLLLVVIEERREVRSGQSPEAQGRRFGLYLCLESLDLGRRLRCCCCFCCRPGPGRRGCL